MREPSHIKSRLCVLLAQWEAEAAEAKAAGQWVTSLVLSRCILDLNHELQRHLAVEDWAERKLKELTQ